MAVPVYNSTNSTWGLQSFIYVLANICYWFFDDSHSDRQEVVFLWTSLWLVMLSAFSCTCWPSIWLLWENVSSDPLPILKLIIYLFAAESYQFSLYFGYSLLIGDYISPYSAGCLSRSSFGSSSFSEPYAMLAAGNSAAAGKLYFLTAWQALEGEASVWPALGPLQLCNSGSCSGNCLLLVSDKISSYVTVSIST